jgi:uncharacterized protein YkwD
MAASWAQPPPSRPGAPTPTVTREGTITLDGNGVRLDETVGGRAGSLSVAYTWEDLTTASTSPGTRTFSFGPLPGQSVTDRVVPVELSLDTDGSVLVDGFRFLAEVPYESGVVNGPITGPDIQPERLGVPGELLPLSVPQPSGIQHGPDPTGVTRLRPSGSTFLPVSWCGTVTTPLERTPGYRVAQANDLIDGAVVLANDPVYADGKIPMPAGTGSFQRRIRVTFTAAQNGAAADPVLPTCDGTAAPTAAFDVAPQPDGVLHEGDAIRFLDRSTDPDGDLATWSWGFGGGRSSSDRNPVLVPGLDTGAREVSLRAADSGGRFNRIFQTLNVTNVLPTVTPVWPLVTVQEGDRATIAVRIDDPGPEARKRLVVRVAEGTTELVRSATYPAGTVQLTLPVLAPGGHTVTVFVYDGNSQFVEVRANVSVAVVRQEVRALAAEQPPVVTLGSCAAPVALAAEEAALLQRWNAAREQAGLAPLALSAELSRAASSLAGQSLGVLGLAPGADVGKAADDAGYGSRNVRALPFSRDLDPVDVLEGLRASEPGTIFTTTGRMVGVAKRAQGTDVKWVVVVGEIVDCEVEPVGAGTAPVLSVTPPAGPLVEGARVELAVTATDPDGDLAEVRVDWGDGTVSGTSHRYRDDGVYDVRVRAVDEQGNVTRSAPVRLTVAGAPPEVDLVAGELVAGVPGTVELAAADPAEGDRPLQLDVSSVPAGVVSFTGTIDGGRTLRVVPPAGSTTLDVTVRVTDNDGQSALRTFSLPVATVGGTPPTAPANVVAPPAPACPSGTTGVALRAQAADFLAQANAFRQSFAAAPLVVSRELQAAAEQHLADLTANRYFAHIDSLGRSPLDRAVANGYGGGVGENIALRFVNGTQVLLGWRASPVHLENLLDPVWNATGVAVGNAPDGVLWVQVFGTVPTCPTTDRGTIPAPTVLANPPIDAAAPVAAWPARPAARAATAAAALPAATPVLAQVGSPAPGPSVAGFTVSRLDPPAGTTVVVTNRSRVDGVPVSGTLSFGSVTGRLLAPDAAFSRAVFTPQDLALAAGGLTAKIAITGTGTYVPEVSIVSPAAGATFDQGAAVAVRVLVTDAGATPLVGVRVRARVNPPGADYVLGATGPDGVAEVVLQPTEAGDVVVEVQAETVGGDTWEATASRNLVVVANEAPVIPTVEPLTVELERALRLWAPAATDADLPISYAWDLDGDGRFGDLGITTRDAEVPWADVSRVICGGVCTVDQPRPITLRATDARGASADAATTVTAVRDFLIAVNPPRLSLPPGRVHDRGRDPRDHEWLHPVGGPVGRRAAHRDHRLLLAGQRGAGAGLPDDAGGGQHLQQHRPDPARDPGHRHRARPRHDRAGGHPAGERAHRPGQDLHRRVVGCGSQRRHRRTGGRCDRHGAWRGFRRDGRRRAMAAGRGAGGRQQRAPDVLDHRRAGRVPRAVHPGHRGVRRRPDRPRRVGPRAAVRARPGDGPRRGQPDGRAGGGNREHGARRPPDLRGAHGRGRRGQCVPPAGRTRQPGQPGGAAPVGARLPPVLRVAQPHPAEPAGRHRGGAAHHPHLLGSLHRRPGRGRRRPASAGGSCHLRDALGPRRRRRSLRDGP